MSATLYPPPKKVMAQLCRLKKSMAHPLRRTGLPAAHRLSLRQWDLRLSKP